VSGNSSNSIVFLSNSFGPSSIYVISFIASAPDDISDKYRVGVLYTIKFSEATNRGNMPASNVSKSQIDNLFDFNSDVYPWGHPLGQDYTGAWSVDNTTFTIVISSVNISQLAVYGPPIPLGTGTAFRLSVKESGDLRNSVYQCSPTVINKLVQALNTYGGPNASGLDCDCCSECGSCNTCSVTYCVSALGNFGAFVPVCSSCCSGPVLCCRILKGNYGIVVAITNVLPRLLPSLGAKLTISGKGFDPQISRNTVTVGGLPCPLVGVSIDAVTREGNVSCICPSGVGPDLKPVRVCHV